MSILRAATVAVKGAVAGQGAGAGFKTPCGPLSLSLHC